MINDRPISWLLTTLKSAAIRAAILLCLPHPLPGQEKTPIRFQNTAEDVGLTFRHISPLTPERHVHLTMGSGIAWIDVDGDDWPDLYCCQGAPWSKRSENQACDELYVNRRGRFRQIEAGFEDSTFYSTGVSIADFNNDGFSDLFVGGLFDSRLYENLGDGTFSRRTAVEGVLNQLYNTSCAWADIDGDGDTDLYVTSYLQITSDDYPLCRRTHNSETVYVTCHPRFLNATNDTVLLNNGDGSFSDVSARCGVKSATPSPGLGVVAADLDSDSDIDFYIANDTVPNHLWVNDGTGNFVESGLLSGVALNRRGLREAGMGVAVGDYDRNGLPDLYVTNYFNETNTFYRNEGAMFFLDVTDETGLGAPSLTRLAFGTNLADFNNDGWLDIFVANGHVNDQLQRLGIEAEPFAQKPQVYQNTASLRFQDVSDQAGEYFSEPIVGRSSAVADYNHDGRLDLAVQHLNSTIGLLQNTTPSTAVPLRLRLIGTTSNRIGLGATVMVVTESESLGHCVTGNSSYLAADELVSTIVVPPGPQQVTVKWPSGRVESWTLRVRKLHYLVEGSGLPE